MIWVRNATIQLRLMFSDHQQYYKVLCGHIMVKSGYFFNIFGDQLHMYMIMNKLSKKNWKNNMIWVRKATIQLCLLFSDQKQYYKVICRHIMVKNGYFSNIFVHQLHMYMIMDKLSKIKCEK